MKLIEPIANLVYKIMKLSLFLCEFILPKEEHVMCDVTTDVIVG